MIATVAASADQYHHSINTLKYANRAKDIKTHIVQNVGSVESHISDYRRIIDNLQVCLPSQCLCLTHAATSYSRGTDVCLLFGVSGGCATSAR